MCLFLSRNLCLSTYDLKGEEDAFCLTIFFTCFPTIFSNFCSSLRRMRAKHSSFRPLYHVSFSEKQPCWIWSDWEGETISFRGSVIVPFYQILINLQLKIKSLKLSKFVVLRKINTFLPISAFIEILFIKLSNLCALRIWKNEYVKNIE